MKWLCKLSFFCSRGRPTVYLNESKLLLSTTQLCFIVSRWSCLVAWQTSATPATWMPQCSVCALCRSSKRLSGGAFFWMLLVPIVSFLSGPGYNSLSLQRWLLCECSLTATSLLFDLPLGILVPCDLQEQMHHHSISQQVLAVANLKCIHLLRLDAFELIVLLFASSALRDLYETMEKTSSSLPPIILLQFLHMAFPQFAEKGDQGQYLQQVENATNLRTFLAFTSLSKCVQCNCLLRALACFVPSGCQRVLAANGESASTKIGATWVRDADGGNYSRPVFPTRCRLPMKLRLN